MFKKRIAALTILLASLALVICFSEGVSFAVPPGKDDLQVLQRVVASGKLSQAIGKKIAETGRAEILLMVEHQDAKKFSKEMRTARRLKSDDAAIIRGKSGLYRQKKGRVLSKISPADYKLLRDYEHFPIMHLKVNKKALAALLKDAEVSRINENRRRALLHRAEAALQRASVLVPLASVPAAFRAAPRLQGVRVDAGGRILLEEAWWEP